MELGRVRRAGIKGSNVATRTPLLPTSSRTASLYLCSILTCRQKFPLRKERDCRDADEEEETASPGCSMPWILLLCPVAQSQVQLSVETPASPGW